MSENFFYFIAGIISSTILGFLVNIYTPKIQNWLDKRPHISKKKKIKSIERELFILENRYRDNRDIYIYVSRNIFLLFTSIVGIVLFSTILILSYFSDVNRILTRFIGFTFIIYISFVTLYNGYLIMFLRKIRRYDLYKEDLEKRLEVLKKMTDVTSQEVS